MTAGATEEKARINRSRLSPATVLAWADPAFVQTSARLFRGFVRVWFRFRLRGDLPPGPVLVVANHSGLGVAELLCLFVTYPARFPGRTARGLMMDMFLAWPVLGPTCKKLGAVPANPANGLAALAAGYDTLVFPGGDVDTCRPFYRPREVIFGARRGYVRLALDSGTLVVPLATVGSHWTWTFAPGGAHFARFSGIKRVFRIERFPLPLNIAGALVIALLVQMHILPVVLGWLLVLFAILPAPVRITSDLLPPIDVRARTAHLETEADKMEEGHRLIHGALQEHVRNADVRFL